MGVSGSTAITRGRFAAVVEKQVANIADIARVLDEVSQDPRSFVIQRKPLDGINRDCADG